ncbi:hypothetical protein BCR41DRAFT_92058 [Lobosporangium transversale]|uniref:ELYS-like domain-containing protein n=1 Tax=Lobosporangium transversale TaxID=64571 RepID=A0A1Y2GMK1_9FUNG|nr:hypothetical protein BCR41DRAFT_92058 [Lobosporangium transversale]ORZ13938.1 hypothetical protein BCR41DRAFT_92058 [Lobosporangium transversale]|eukprot:XP_021880722.1 hypothetical protein BCR41DRAFT_92058 [Lobosporangium transversale]
MNGFWSLDNFEFKNAVFYLSRPGLTVDWIEDVVEAISLHGSPQLARQFLVAANLNLTSERFIDLKMKILLDTDFTEAFYFQRSVTRLNPEEDASDDAHMVLDVSAEKDGYLFVQLLDYTFLNKPNRKAIQSLSLLTMNEREEQIFIRYCDTHPGLTREVAQEFLIMYYVSHSRYMEAIRMHRKLLAVELEKEGMAQLHHAAMERNNVNGVSKQELSKSQKRQVLINNLMKILPETQKVLLDLETERQDAKVDTDGTKVAVKSLMKDLNGSLTSLTGMDLNWVTGSSDQTVALNGDEDKGKQSGKKEDKVLYAPAKLLGDCTKTIDNRISRAEVMEVDSDEDL